MGTRLRWYIIAIAKSDPESIELRGGRGRNALRSGLEVVPRLANEINEEQPFEREESRLLAPVRCEKGRGDRHDKAEWGSNSRAWDFCRR